MLSTLAFTALLPLAALAQNADSQACRSFVPTSGPFDPHFREGPPLRSSPGAICDFDDGRPCWISNVTDDAVVEQYNQELNATQIRMSTTSSFTGESELNITTPSREATEGVYELIGSTLNVTFWERFVFWTGNPSPIIIPNGAVGYVALYMNLACWNGTLEECPAGGWASNGTALEACTPRASRSPRDRWNFSIRFFNSTIEEAQQPFNGSIQPGDPGTTAWYEPEGAAGQKEVAGALMSIAFLVSIMWLL